MHFRPVTGLQASEDARPRIRYAAGKENRATGVDISGLDIRNFCIGILIHRSSGNVVHDNRIVANRGGAGMLITGDDGSGGSTATTTLHNKVLRNEFLDNGDGAELTRGAAFNLVADNVFRSTSTNKEPSQGVPSTCPCTITSLPRPVF